MIAVYVYTGVETKVNDDLGVRPIGKPHARGTVTKDKGQSNLYGNPDFVAREGKTYMIVFVDESIIKDFINKTVWRLRGRIRSMHIRLFVTDEKECRANCVNPKTWFVKHMRDVYGRVVR